MNFVILTQAQANALINLANTILAYPKTESETEAESVRVGGGVHVPWVMCRAVRYAVARKHPTRDEWAVPVRILRAIWQAYQAGTLPEPIRQRIQSLTAAQRTAIRDAIQAAMELPADWRPASII